MSRTVTTITYFNNEVSEVQSIDVWSHKSDYHDHIDAQCISVTTYHVCPTCGERDEVLNNHQAHVEDCFDA